MLRADATWLGTCEKCAGVLLVTLADSPSGGDENLPAVAPAPAPGTVYLTPEFLARFDLLHPIGEGATASVFLGRDKSDGGKLVAIKFLAQTGKRQVITRFQREAKLLATIRHPNVIHLYDSGEIDGRPYLVNEFCEGGTLRSKISITREKTPENALMEPVLRTPDLGVRLQPKQAITLMLDVLAGLEACHQHSIIHRDLKPENILITGEGEIRLADFGVAREEATGEPSLTPMGAVIGTPRYMAPEQVRGDRATPLTDVYAAGAILFEMLSGKPPFVEDHTFELLRSQLDKPPPPLRDKYPEIPVALEALVHRALAKSPDKRPGSAGAFAAELRTCLEILEGKKPDIAPVAAPAAIPSASIVQPASGGGAGPLVWGLVGLALLVAVVIARLPPPEHDGTEASPSIVPFELPGDPLAAQDFSGRLQAAENAINAGQYSVAKTALDAADGLVPKLMKPASKKIEVVRMRVRLALKENRLEDARKLLMTAHEIPGADPADVKTVEALMNGVQAPR